MLPFYTEDEVCPYNKKIGKKLGLFAWPPELWGPLFELDGGAAAGITALNPSDIKVTSVRASAKRKADFFVTFLFPPQHRLQLPQKCLARNRRYHPVVPEEPAKPGKVHRMLHQVR